jgi:hypothetical protein
MALHELVCVLIQEIFLPLYTLQCIKADAIRLTDGFNGGGVPQFSPAERRGGVPIRLRLIRRHYPLQTGEQGFGAKV